MYLYITFNLCMMIYNKIIKNLCIRKHDWTNQWKDTSILRLIDN